MAKSRNSRMKQAGVTPVKLALIGILAVVLAGVLYNQFIPMSNPTTTEPPAPRPVTRAAAASNRARSVANDATSSTATRKKTGTVANWQSPNLKAVVAYDPFALPAAFPQPKSADEAALAQDAAATQDDAARLAALTAARAQAESELQQLRQQGVNVIVTRDNKRAAIVGDQIIHVGDEINGFRVIAIEGNDVRVEKDLTQ